MDKITFNFPTHSTSKMCYEVEAPTGYKVEPSVFEGCYFFNFINKHGCFEHHGSLTGGYNFCTWMSAKAWFD